MTRLRALLIGITGHLLLSLVHGVVHLTVPVTIHGWQYGYTVVVVVLAPIFGVLLISRDRPIAGGLLVVISGIAAFTFEGLYHFVVVNPDRVATVTTGQTVFTMTAWFTTIGDVVLVTVTVWFLADAIPSHQDDSIRESVLRQ